MQMNCFILLYLYFNVLKVELKEHLLFCMVKEHRKNQEGFVFIFAD